jgi:hypothetical protein
VAVRFAPLPSGSMRNRAFMAPKVPAVLLLFWVVKVLTTGIGETGADFMGSVSIPLAGVVGVGGFFLALWLQLRADRYHPVRYWSTVLGVALFGRSARRPRHAVLVRLDRLPGAPRRPAGLVEAQ